MKRSFIIPAHDEADSITGTVEGGHARAGREGLDVEVLVVDDASTARPGRSW